MSVGVLRTPWNVAEKVLELVNLWFKHAVRDASEMPPHALTHSLSCQLPWAWPWGGAYEVVLRSSRKVSLQPYTVTDANALSAENERS